MADVFVSYAREDLKQVRPIVEVLEKHGWSVFWDRNIQPGQQWSDLIEGKLKSSKAVIVVWSLAAAKSSWVKAEAMAAHEWGNLVLVRIDGEPIPKPFTLIETADVSSRSTSEQRGAMSQVVTAIGKLLNEPIINGSTSTPSPAKSLNTVTKYDWVHSFFDSPFQIRSATGQHRRHGGVSGGKKGRGQGL